MASIIRIVSGVIVGGCLLAGLLAAAMRFPTVAAFVMFGGIAAFILYMAYDGFRTGVIHAKRSRYERGSTPFGYWFYVSFYALIGAVVFGYALYSVLGPLLGKR